MTWLATLIFDHAQLKNFWSAFNFCESVSIYKKWVIPSAHSLDKVNFRVLLPDWHHTFLTMPTPNILKQLLIHINLYQHAKNLSIPSLHSSDTINSRVQRPDRSPPFLNMPNQKIWICINMQNMRLYHYFVLEKYPGISLAESILAYISKTGFFQI